MIEPSLLRAAATGSGAERWLNCPASVSMELHLKEGKKKYADEGTQAHKAAAAAITKRTPLEEIEDDAVRLYVGTVRDVAGPGEFIVEERFPLLGSSGGLDCLAPRGKTGFLFDYKHGIGVKLTAHENEQLAFYGVAARERFRELTTIQAWLVQPRVEGLFEDVANISSWTLPYQTLGAWRRTFQEGLLEVEKAAKLSAGPWCRFCKAKGGCPAYVTYSETLLKEQAEFPEGLIPAPGQTWLPDAIPRVARLLLMKEVAMSHLNKCEEFLLMVAKSSPEMELLVKQHGFEIGRKRSNRKWRHELGLPLGDQETPFDTPVDEPEPKPMTEEETAAILRGRGIPDPYKRKLIPLTAAEELVSVDDLVFKPEGGETLRAIERQKGKRLLPPKQNDSISEGGGT